VEVEAVAKEVGTLVREELEKIGDVLSEGKRRSSRGSRRSAGNASVIGWRTGLRPSEI
jgi:hypothetical protein